MSAFSPQAAEAGWFESKTCIDILSPFNIENITACNIAVFSEIRYVFMLSYCGYVIFVFFKRNALLNTEIELIAIAAPATTGLSKPNAANGMPNTL